MRLVNDTVLGHDNPGRVEIITYTKKGDLLVVNAARCSFDKEHDELDESDKKLINYLAREKHLLPFRHPQVTLRMNIPIYILRQLSKHQIGFSWSEVSRRYIKTEARFHIPSFRKAADNVKQGSSKEEFGPMDMFDAQRRVHVSDVAAIDSYNCLLEMGAAPEQARVVLPQSMFTTVVVTGSLLGWHHMYTQRTEEHAQSETQEYARAIGGMMQYCFPMSWEALCEHSS